MVGAAGHGFVGEGLNVDGAEERAGQGLGEAEGDGVDVETAAGGIGCCAEFEFACGGRVHR